MSLAKKILSTNGKLVVFILKLRGCGTGAIEHVKEEIYTLETPFRLAFNRRRFLRCPFFIC